jgi:hypothetical protein
MASGTDAPDGSSKHNTLDVELTSFIFTILHLKQLNSRS